MRINHVGEVCAQGLYGGAKFFAQSDTTYQFLHQAQKDELTHLSWCNIRLSQLNGRPSYLIPFIMLPHSQWVLVLVLSVIRFLWDLW